MEKRGFSLIAMIIIIVFLIIGAVSAVVVYYNKKGGGSLSPEIKETPTIPEKCQDFKDDVCDLFSCVVDNCWCKEGTSSGPVLDETNKQITNNEDAVDAVSDYLESVNSEYIYNATAAKLNDLFFNVFVYNSSGDEKVFTVSFDGKILETVCGI